MMTALMRTCGVLLAVLIVHGGPVRAEGDPEAGAKVYKKCIVCHDIETEKNKVGPHLVGVFGRTAGSVEGFRYSQALSNSGIVWDDETITAYMRNPRTYIPGNRMAFAGLKSDQDIIDVIAYMKQTTGQ